MKKLTTLLTIGCASLGIQSASANLIVNGNFSSGNTGFSSDYSYAGTNTAAGEYYILSSAANTWNSGFLPIVGYGGSGSYYLGNGATSTAESPWFQTINSPSVTLTTNPASPVFYRFEAQIANVVPLGYAEPDLAFEISVNGGAWNKFTSTPSLTPGSWTLVYADTYLTSAPSSLGFRLRNQATEYVGNDFAVDSIYFGLSTNAPSYPSSGILSAGDIANPTFVGPTGVPEPGQVAASLLLLGGIGGYVFLKRRQTVKPTAAPTAA